jgi:ribosomal protein L4
MSESLRDGHQARNELTQTEAAFAKLEAKLYEEMIATTVEQSVKREKLYMAINSLRSVKALLINVAQNVDIETAIAQSGLNNPHG